MDASKVVLNQTNSPLLSLLYHSAEESFYMREMMVTLDMGSRSIQKGLKDLTKAGLITRTKRDGHAFYQANKSSDLFPEIQSLVAKVTLRKYPSLVRAALKPLQPKIRTAFVFGSVARNEARPGSDIDLMIVGNVAFKDLVPRLKSAGARLHREIHPIVFSETDFRARVNENNHFLRTVMDGTKVILLGDKDDIANLGG